MKVGGKYEGGVEIFQTGRVTGGAHKECLDLMRKGVLRTLIICR